MANGLELNKGIIFVASGPSGVGKTTVCNRLVEKYSDVTHSISTTSRSPRKGEINGKDYIFVEEEEFREKIREGKFAEWAKVLENYYGTEYESLDKGLKAGKDIILSIDVQGAANIKKYYPESVLIFLLPPSMEELVKRLENRGSEHEKQIRERLNLANEEIKELGNYDYMVINEKVNVAVDNIRWIINAERSTVRRYDVQEVIKNIKRR